MRLLVANYKRGLELMLLSLPLWVAGYLHWFQDPALKFDSHPFHMAAIGLACLLGGFVSFVSWQCYRESGEPFLRYVTLAFLGFTLVYTPHGLLTPMAHTNVWAFLLYGPVSRLVMAGFMMLALLNYGRPADSPEARAQGWWSWIGLMLALVPATFWLAHSPLAPLFGTRLVIEAVAILLGLAAVVMQLRRGIRSPLMGYFLIAQVGFAESCGIFLIAKIWNHQWWWAHAVFAGRFLLLSYGVARAWLTTRAFASVYSPEEMIAKLAAANAAQDAAREAEAQLRAVFDSSPDGVLVLAGPEEVLFRNRRLTELLGDCLAQVLPKLNDVVGTELRNAERGLPAADGRTLWVLLSTMPITYGGRPATVLWITDISRRVEMEDRLREALLQAELSDRAKSTFLTTMGHELRTPLNHLLGFSEAMRDQMFGPLDARYCDYAATIHKAAGQLSSVIEQVLDLSHLDVGGMRLRDEDTDPAALVEAVLGVMRPKAEEAGLRLVLDLPAELPRLRGDAVRIQQILLNLLSNAIKFTPAGGTVSVGASVRPDGLELVVADTGIGISAEELPRALDAFAQIDPRLARRYEGVGLGLPLSQRLVALHQGTLTVESEPGQGTRVVVRFPAQRLVAKEQAPVDAR